MTDNTDSTSTQNLENELSGNRANEPEVPEKFKGKSAAEIVAMYQAQESELGRKNNEVGQLRRLTDEVLGLAKATRDSNNQVAKKPITSEDLLSDPDRVVTERVREVADERGAAQEARTARLESQLALQSFERKFPTYANDLTDAKFLNWVQKTGTRQSLAGRAANGDYFAADELFTLYNEAKPETNGGASNLDAARKASLAKGGGSAVADTTGSGKKIYKREDLIDMRIKNREEFDRRFETEFFPAYREGRVK